MAKKILYIYGGLYTPNGMSAIISQKINYLAENTDYDMYIVLTEHPEKKMFYQLSDKVHRKDIVLNFDDLDTMPLFKKMIYYWIKQRKYKRMLTQYLMELRPDITVSITRREINFLTKIKDGSKKIAEIHFARTYYRQLNLSFLPKRVNKWISKIWMNNLIRSLKQLDRFIVLTNEDKQNWTELDNVSVIPNFVTSVSMDKSDCNMKRVIAVGRYSWQKGFDMLISAWQIVYQSHPEWLLDIYGDGDSDTYQTIADNLGLSSVIHCNHAIRDIYHEYVKSSIFVLCSRFEGLPLVLIEAMGAGIPVVAFSCPCGPRDLIRNGYNGLLVENGNVNELADKIITLIENEDLRYHMGMNAVPSTALYTRDKVMLQWIKLFDEL
jgi:glycosyltransferase involved in cell wall biosynthesis